MQTEVKDVPPSMPMGRSDLGSTRNWEYQLYFPQLELLCLHWVLHP